MVGDQCQNVECWKGKCLYFVLLCHFYIQINYNTFGMLHGKINAMAVPLMFSPLPAVMLLSMQHFQKQNCLRIDTPLKPLKTCLFHGESTEITVKHCRQEGKLKRQPDCPCQQPTLGSNRLGAMHATNQLCRHMYCNHAQTFCIYSRHDLMILPKYIISSVETSNRVQCQFFASKLLIIQCGSYKLTPTVERILMYIRTVLANV